jgi:CxxC motif-containing protein (DUF1111 family)
LTSHAPADAAAFEQRAPNATGDDELYYNSGVGFFRAPWLQAPSTTRTRQGLGPLYDALACGECHAGNGRGHPPLETGEPAVGLVLRLSVPGQGPHGEPLREATYGEQLQRFGVAGVPPEGTLVVGNEEEPGQYGDGTPYSSSRPSYTLSELGYGPLETDYLASVRVAPAPLGLGLLEAIPEARLQQLADPDDVDGDGISGRINHVWDIERGQTALGRFGWKAEQPSLRQQAASAFAADLGVTSSLYPAQNCTRAEPECAAQVSAEARAAAAAAAAGMDAGTESGAGSDEAAELEPRVLDRIETYLRLIAVPARRGGLERQLATGQVWFGSLGCTGCHVPSHVTAPDAPLEELRNQVIWPYTDLLLHDLGPDLDDHRQGFEASGSEWRTAPLWGLGLYRTVDGHERLLHDGRARGVAEAILWHGGEAQTARDAFTRLPAYDRDAVVAFVESL